MMISTASIPKGKAGWCTTISRMLFSITRKSNLPDVHLKEIKNETSSHFFVLNIFAEMNAVIGTVRIAPMLLASDEISSVDT